MATVFRATDDGLGDLRFEREVIEVTSSLPSADEGWRFSDAAGHEHYYRDGYPTLVAVVDDRYWCDDCGDEHIDSHWECPQCGERITPGLVGPDCFRRFAPGRAKWTLDGQPISEERAQEIIEARRGRGI